MKNIFFKLLSVLLAANIFLACSNDDTDPQAAVLAKPEIISPASGGNYVLSGANANDEIFVVEISPANFGFSAATQYMLQVCLATDNFTTIGTVNLGNFTSPGSGNLIISVKQRDLNTGLLGAGGAIGFNNNYKMRAFAKTTAGNLEAIGDVVITFSATAYDSFDEFPRIYVPGNYQTASAFGTNWTPSNAPMLFSANSDGKYEGFVYMNDPNPEFKFTPGPSWTGDKGDVNPSGNTGSLTSPGHNIKIPGYVGNDNSTFIEVDWNANTYTAAKRQVCIIGSAVGGWGSPTYLTFDTNPSSPHFRKYTALVNLTSGGEFLIRTEDTWASKLGGGLPDSNVYNMNNVSTPKKLFRQGGNIKVFQSGSYRVVVDLKNSANYNVVFVTP